MYKRQAKAERIETKVGRAHLTGEAARRHIQALSRLGGTENQPHIEHMQSILDYNWQYFQKRVKNNRTHSSDEVALLCMTAAVRRVEGDFDAATSLLQQAKDHPFIPKRLIPYIALRELRLEEMKLMSATGEGFSLSDAEALVDDLVDHNHQLLAYECVLVACEQENACGSLTLEDAEEWCEMTGWSLRVEDIQLIRSGHKPSMMFAA